MYWLLTRAFFVPHTTRRGRVWQKSTCVSTRSSLTKYILTIWRCAEYHLPPDDDSDSDDSDDEDLPGDAQPVPAAAAEGSAGDAPDAPPEVAEILADMGYMSASERRRLKREQLEALEAKRSTRPRAASHLSGACLCFCACLASA
jgi:hypothetical protein